MKMDAAAGSDGREITLLSVEGMNCANCVRHVREAIESVEGVERAEVRLEDGQATVVWKPGEAARFAEVANSVREAGYESRAAPRAAGRRSLWDRLTRGWGFNVVFGSLVAFPLMALEWGAGLGMARWFQWFSFALATPLQAVGGARFYRGAWAQLKSRSANMDTLVALGSTAAFGYSVWGLFSGAPMHLYFMDSAAIITLISIGHWLESKASAQAANSLHALLRLAPEQARRLAKDGQERLVRASQLQPDELIAIRPGDRIPTDSEVIDGHSAVDESMLTGESRPVEKTPGEKIYGGTVNQNGRLVARVTAVGEATALARIMAMVERAQSSRARIQRVGDRISSIFVPVVVVVAAAAAAGWGLAPETMQRLHHWLGQYLWQSAMPANPLSAAIYVLAAVLIIACPCAMGLATPVAIMSGANVAARRGILIRDGIALEKSGRITGVVFDKTGTLTQGQMSVAGWERLEPAASGPSEKDWPAVAGCLARHSTHPLSRALAEWRRGVWPARDWTEHRGAGVEATLQLPGAPEERFRLGSLRWLEESGVELASAKDFLEAWGSRGATVLGLAQGGTLRALFGLEDKLKPRAPAVVEQLRRQGKKVYLMTGDARATALAIARQSGIEEDAVFAEIRPEQKAEAIARLQAQGERLAFIGDGINDAPALEQAELGIAVSQASDVAREAADIILLKSEIEAAPEALGLAQAALRVIYQNLFWAFFYNAAGVPLAALGFFSPVLSALAMGASDLIVVGNALRLRWRRWSS